MQVRRNSQPEILTSDSDQPTIKTYTIEPATTPPYQEPQHFSVKYETHTSERDTKVEIESTTPFAAELGNSGSVKVIFSPGDMLDESTQEAEADRKAINTGKGDEASRSEDEIAEDIEFGNGDEAEREEDYYDDESDAEFDDEEAPLLAEDDDEYDDDEEEHVEKKESWWGFTKRIVKTAIGTVARYTAATVLAVPTAVYAFTTLSKYGPKDLPLAWGSLGSGPLGIFKKILSVAFGGSSLWVNAKLNNDFFLQVFDRVKKAVKESRKSLKKFLIFACSIGFGIAGGIPAAALAYDGMESIPAAAILFLVANFGIYALGRFLGVNKLANRLFNPDHSRVQYELVDKLNHLKSEYRDDLQSIIDAKAKKLLRQHRTNGEAPQLTKEDFDKIMVKLAKRLSELADLHPNQVFNEKTNLEYAKEYGGMLFDLTLSTLVTSWAFTTFSQKGYKGVEIFFKFFDKDISDISNIYKILMGMSGGIASGSLYGISAYDLRKLAYFAAQELMKNPRQIPQFLVGLLTQVLAASSMYKVGIDIPGPTNIFYIPAHPMAVQVSGGLGGEGSLDVNILTFLKSYIPVPDRKNPKFEQFKRFYEIPAANAIDEDQTTKIRRDITLFKAPRPKTCRDEERINDESLRHSVMLS